MSVTKIPQLLLIAGNGRDSGKTTLACRLISRFSALMPVVSMKISPHQHQSIYGDLHLNENNRFSITEESDPSGRKDSARMLAAGARRSFFISAADDHLELLIPTLVELTSEGNFIVCESGGLRNIAEPGLFLVVGRLSHEDSPGRKVLKPQLKKLLAFEHTWVLFDGCDFYPGTDSLYVNEGTWKIRHS